MTGSVTDIGAPGRRADDRLGRGSAAASTRAGTATAASRIRTGQIIAPGASLDSHDPRSGVGRTGSFAIR